MNHASAVHVVHVHYNSLNFNKIRLYICVVIPVGMAAFFLCGHRKVREVEH